MSTTPIYDSLFEQQETETRVNLLQVALRTTIAASAKLRAGMAAIVREASA